MITIDNEKSPRLYSAEAETKAGAHMNAMSIVDEDVGTVEDLGTSGFSGADDALKLAGTHAHNFDEQYYRRLRWKIVS